jgi:hypothetical protein
MNSNTNIDNSNLINQVLSDRNLYVKTFFERPDSFAKLLPYEEYLSDSGIFILKDGSLGAVFDVDLIQHEPLEAERIVESVESLKSWFSLPENCTLQFLFDQSYIPKRDRVWAEVLNTFNSPHPVANRILSERVKLFKSYCEGNSKLSPMRRRTLMSIRYFPENVKGKTLFRMLERGEKLLFDTMSTMKNEIVDFSQILAQIKESSKVQLNRVTGDDIVDFLRRFFNPKEYLEREFAPVSPATSISEQIVFTSPIGSFTGIEREKVKTRTITLKTNPRRVFPGGMANFLPLDFPYKISINFSFPERNKVKSYFDIKEFFLQNSPNARSRRQLQDLKEIQDRLAHDERCLFMTFCVIIEGETEEELNSRSRSITSIFHNDLECEVIKEELIGLGMCLNALPLFYSPASDYSSQRFIRIMKTDATKLLPVFDSYKGTNKNTQLFLSRESNLVKFSWLANDISNHTVILGDTGSGKSKFALDCVQSIKLQSPEPLVFVIDKRASCEYLCRDFEGELSVFDPRRAMPFSPFRGVFDEFKIQFLTQLILTAVKITSTTFESESHHLTIISRSLKEAYLRRAREKGVSYKDGKLIDEDSKNEVAVSMDDVIAAMSGLTSEEEFENLKDQIDDLISRLMPFYSDGIYAPYFKANDKTKKKSLKNTLLYAYDLEALDSDETLKVLMSMCVIHEIMSIMNEPQNLKRGGVLYIEELGCLGRDNPIVGDFIVEAAERMRKMGFFLLGVAPNPKVYFETAAGKALWGGADNFFFLQMSPDNVRYLKENSSLLKPGALEIAGSLATKLGEYAEVFYTNKNSTHQGAFRYIQSDLDRKTSVNSEREKNNE